MSYDHEPGLAYVRLSKQLSIIASELTRLSGAHLKARSRNSYFGSSGLALPCWLVVEQGVVGLGGVFTGRTK